MNTTFFFVECWPSGLREYTTLTVKEGDLIGKYEGRLLELPEIPQPVRMAIQAIWSLLTNNWVTEGATDISIEFRTEQADIYVDVTVANNYRYTIGKLSESFERILVDSVPFVGQWIRNVQHQLDEASQKKAICL